MGISRKIKRKNKPPLQGRRCPKCKSELYDKTAEKIIACANCGYYKPMESEGADGK